MVEKKFEKFVRAARKYWREHEDSWATYDKLRRFDEDGIMAFEYGYDIQQNPLVVPEVQKAIDRARTIKKGCLKSRFCKAPLDVAIMIAEWTCPIEYTTSDVKNTRNMLFAFQWRLPDWFWQSRLKGHSFFELDKLRDAHFSIDWQALWLDLLCLLSDQKWYGSSGLANRERVLKLMNGIKANFLEMR